MKSFKIFLPSVLLLMLTACSLDQEYYGSTLTQAQYEKLANTLEGSMRGIYSQLYAVSDHDQFGQRSIDMYTDLLSGDMALTNYSYGWFYSDEKGLTPTARTGYTWFFYYRIIHNANVVVNLVKAQSKVLDKVVEFGLPNTYNSSKAQFYRIQGKDTLATYSEEEAQVGLYYAQALTMRGFAYSKLLQYYTYTTRELYAGGGSFQSVLCFPIYDEVNMAKSQPLATIAEAYTQLESDLTNAVAYFEAFEQASTRMTKLEVNQDIARGMLAFNYLGKINLKASSTSESYAKPARLALEAAEKIIESGKYTIIPSNQVYGDNATGFNSTSCSSWIWGQDVTTETAGGLASFFGQVDIHSYSYAWAGDTKAIDENLYNTIYPFDSRAKWFNDGKSNTVFKLCPDGKFFSAKCPKSTKAEDIDREWLSHNVFMRIEAIYLIAAEAAYRLKDYSKATQYLTAITDERVLPDQQTAYTTYKSTLNASTLLAAIEYNWRVEMWGEGYGLATFRRLSPEAAEKRRRGGNHAANPGVEIETGGSYIFQIPSSETSYNPNLTKKLEQ